MVSVMLVTAGAVLGTRFFEVATGGGGDGCLDSAGVFVDVVFWRIDGHETGGFARFDGDDGAVAERDSHWCAGRIGQGRGVGDLAALIHGAGRGQRQVGGVLGIGNRGVSRLAVDFQFFS